MNTSDLEDDYPGQEPGIQPLTGGVGPAGQYTGYFEPGSDDGSYEDSGEEGSER